MDSVSIVAIGINYSLRGWQWGSDLSDRLWAWELPSRRLWPLSLNNRMKEIL